MKPFEVSHALAMRVCALPSEQGGAAYPVAFCLNEAIYRTVEELEAELERLSLCADCVPVVACFGLADVMHALSAWLSSHDCEVLAKGSEAPITIKLLDEGGLPRLVLWELANMDSRPLEVLADECGTCLGSFDRSAVRTPETPLTPAELANMRAECETIHAYIERFLSLNPEVKPEQLAHNIVTATSVVRVKRKAALGRLKGEGAKKSVLANWYAQNLREAAETDDELFTMQACNRGGFSFVGAEHASRPYSFTHESGFLVAAYDAVSQYPAQMVSHMYPEGFRPTTAECLQLDAQIVQAVTLEQLLTNVWEPFPVAFEGAFSFQNLRVRRGSVFEENGIALLQWARFNERQVVSSPDRESQVRATNALRFAGYKDSCADPVRLFGKLVSASSALIWLTELEFWLLCQIYEFDSFEALQGYDTAKFCRPTDISVLGVMRFYQAKKAAKGTESYEQAKKELNSLYGIEAVNEARPSAVMTDNGIEFLEPVGVEDLPERPKAWYQFGSRVAAWGRVAQVVEMLLAAPYVNGIINGDTDSIKMIVHESNLGMLDNALARWGQALDVGRALVCQRVEDGFKDRFEQLDGIGYYDLEYLTRDYCAGWNKAYIYRKTDKTLNVTIAGVKTSTETVFRGEVDRTYTDLANELDERYSFETAANLILGYNVTVDSGITRHVEHLTPQWGARVSQRVTDYLGNVSHVDAPQVTAYKPLGLVIGNSLDPDTNADMRKAIGNNPELSHESVYIYWEPGQRPHLGRFTLWGMESEEL